MLFLDFLKEFRDISVSPQRDTKQQAQVVANLRQEVVLQSVFAERAERLLLLIGDCPGPGHGRLRRAHLRSMSAVVGHSEETPRISFCNL